MVGVPGQKRGQHALPEPALTLGWGLVLARCGGDFSGDGFELLVGKNGRFRRAMGLEGFKPGQLQRPRRARASG